MLVFESIESRGSVKGSTIDKQSYASMTMVREIHEDDDMGNGLMLIKM